MNPMNPICVNHVADVLQATQRNVVSECGPIHDPQPHCPFGFGSLWNWFHCLRKLAEVVKARNHIYRSTPFEQCQL